MIGRDYGRERHPGAIGMVDALPGPEGWTPERRQQWIDTLMVVVDFEVSVVAQDEKPAS